jgi:hypothetical protein
MSRNKPVAFERTFRAPPFPESHAPTLDEILEQTRPNAAMDAVRAKGRLAEILAQVAEIGRQIEDRKLETISLRKAKPRAVDPHETWRRAAGNARNELYREASMLRSFLRQSSSEDRSHRRVADIARQDSDRTLKQARKAAKKNQMTPIWDAYLKAEVALLAIMSASGDVGPLGESLLQTAKNSVPEWYREHWLRTVYGTTWGREAERTR